MIGEQDIPDPQPERWQEQLKDVGRTLRATILRHRDIVRISIGLPSDRFPTLVAVAEHVAISDPDERFEVLLDLYVEGLAERATER